MSIDTDVICINSLVVWMSIKHVKSNNGRNRFELGSWTICYVSIYEADTIIHLIPSLAKKVMFSVVLVCLSLCLFVSNSSQKIINKLQCNFIEGYNEELIKFWWRSGSSKVSK